MSALCQKRPLASVSGCPCRNGLPMRFRWGRSMRHANVRRLTLAYLEFSPVQRAQVSSNLAPGAPLAPIAPMVSSPSLMTTPPPKNRTCGSLDNGAISPPPKSFALKAREAVLQSHLARGLIFRTYAGASVFRFRLGFRSPVIRSFQFERAGLASVCKQWRHRLYRCNPLLR